jgi:hypothetical protein
MNGDELEQQVALGPAGMALPDGRRDKATTLWVNERARANRPAYPWRIEQTSLVAHHAAAAASRPRRSTSPPGHAGLLASQARDRLHALR